MARLHLLHFVTFAALILPPTVSAQSSDAFAIYSDLISKSPVVRTGPGNVPTDDQIYLIEATTATDRSGYGPPGTRSLFTAESCLKTPPVDDASLREILADYNSRKNTPVALKRLFTFTKPYQLLTAAESDRFLREALEVRPPANK